MSLNVSLPVELENRVREHVASGLYGSASEVIREALRLFEHTKQRKPIIYFTCEVKFIKACWMSSPSESVF